MNNQNNLDNINTLENSLELINLTIKRYASHYLVTEENAWNYLLGREGSFENLKNKVQYTNLEIIQKSFNDFNMYKNEDGNYKSLSIILEDISKEFHEKVI